MYGERTKKFVVGDALLLCTRSSALLIDRMEFDDNFNLVIRHRRVEADNFRRHFECSRYVYFALPNDGSNASLQALIVQGVMI
jgi:hypothetical protein